MSDRGDAGETPDDERADAPPESAPDERDGEGSRPTAEEDTTGSPDGDSEIPEDEVTGPFDGEILGSDSDGESEEAADSDDEGSDDDLTFGTADGDDSTGPELGTADLELGDGPDGEGDAPDGEEDEDADSTDEGDGLDDEPLEDADSTGEDADSTDGDDGASDDEGPGDLDISDDQLASAGVSVGEYDWEDFKEEFFYENGSPPTNWRGKPQSFESAEYLGFDAAETGDRVADAAETATGLSAYFEDFLDPEKTPVELGEYLWEHFRYEYYYDESEDGVRQPRDENGEVVPFDRSEWVGHDDLPASVFEGGVAATDLSASFEAWLDPATTPVTKGEYFWEHFKYEYYYADTSVTPPERPRDEEGKIERFDDEEWLGFSDEDTEEVLAEAGANARKLKDIVDERTLDVHEELDEDAFFSTVEGHTTLVNRYDLEKEVSLPKKQHFREVERYWVNKPYSFVIIFHSEKENETKYYLIEPYCTPIESDLTEFLTSKLRASIKYSSDDVVVEAEDDERADVIEREAMRLLARYDLYPDSDVERAEQLRELLERYDETKETVAEVLTPVREGTDAATAPIRGAFGGRGGTDDESATADAEADREAVAADGGTPTDDGADAGDATAAPDSPETADSPDLPARPGEDDADLPATDANDGKGEPRIRLDKYLDVEFEAEGSLRNQIRTAVEAKIAELEPDESAGLDGISVRPEPVLIEEDDESLSEYQAEKLLYYLKRDFTGYERIDGIKHDINVEDISCDGYNSPVFVYHTDYEQIITNVYHGEDELDDFVVKMAQRSGKGISKRQPQVDATLPDGSRAQLTLGREVSDHGTNYTIRQFKDVPFTPVDLVNWNTFSLEEMAFMWLAIENHKSLIFAGGTASGKTTSLNAVSLFIPSNTKIVSIEDTREVELPQRNWIASVTRPSFSDDDKGDVDEFDLLEAALRQRPDYIVMGEIRGEEGRTLFQVMSTGHTTYTTFHADTVGEVLKRFTTEPINVSKTLFTALDLVSIQTQTRVQGQKVRRNKSLTEINEYNAENDEINVQDIFQWRAEDDEFMRLSGSNTMEEIMFDRGWSREQLEREILKRRVILAYLIKNGLNEYTQVAATVQAFINDPDTILTLVANEKLEESLEDLREMESVHIDIDPKKEEMVPRPDPVEETYELAKGILAEAEDRLLDEYRGADADVEGLAVALAETHEPTDVSEEDASDAGPASGSPVDLGLGPGDESEADADDADESDEVEGPFGGDILGPDDAGSEVLDGLRGEAGPADADASSLADRIDELGDDERSPDEGDESVLGENFGNSEPVNPEDSVRDPNDAGELGRFPSEYGEGSEDEGPPTDGAAERPDWDAGRSSEDDTGDVDIGDGTTDAPERDDDADDSDITFGDFEAAFDDDDEEDER